MYGKTIGQYRILEKLGEGGMGIVYKAEQISLKRTVAIKVLPQHLTSDPSFVQRFLNEACAIAALNHPNIVQIFDVAKEGETYYYPMEFIDGDSLDDILARRGAVSFTRAVTIISRLARALAYTHERGIVHRDLKPSNIMLDKRGNVKLMDFGLALQEKMKRVTMDGDIAGTPEYMSPEQASGKNATPLSDVYSLGVVFYELLTGVVPFEADTTLSLIKKIQMEQPVSPRTINPEIPPEVERIVLKMMEKDPKKRYKDCRTIRADLKNFREGKEAVVESFPDSFWERQKTNVIAATVSIAFIVATISCILILWPDSEKEEAILAKERMQKLKIMADEKQAAVHARNTYTRARQKLREGDEKYKRRDYVAATGLYQEAAMFWGKSIAEAKLEAAVKKINKNKKLLAFHVGKIQESLGSVGERLLLVKNAIKSPVSEGEFHYRIVLKDGEEIECEVLSEDPKWIRIRTDKGATNISRERIRNIFPDATDKASGWSAMLLKAEPMDRSAWNYAHLIKVDNTVNPVSLIDYPAELNLNLSNFDFDCAHAKGNDIRFAGGCAPALSYFIEEWDPNLEKVRIWIKVPIIPASSEVTLFMYCGNTDSAIKSGSSYKGVFDIDFDRRRASDGAEFLKPPGPKPRIFVAGKADGNGISTELNLRVAGIQASLYLCEDELQSVQNIILYDTVMLKGGKKIKGKILSEDSKSVRFRRGKKTIEIPQSYIESMIRITPETREELFELQLEIKKIEGQTERMELLVNEIGLLNDKVSVAHANLVEPTIPEKSLPGGPEESE